jgi:adenine deaminase
MMEGKSAVPPRWDRVRAARGLDTADTLFLNAEIYNSFTSGWYLTDLAVKDGLVAGIGPYPARNEVDLKGRRVVPGLIDAHVHIESSLLAPPEFARLVSQHGTTTVVADPHEIANVLGVAGIEFMLSQRETLPLDLFIMLPSCVPATPSDIGGARLEAADLEPFKGLPGVLGLGEVMNVPGVLQGDPDLYRKLDLFPVIDGHAPLLTGRDLFAYLAAGIESDHECTGASEAREKVEQGMFIYLREGSTERNIKVIAPVVTAANCPRFSFATDDRHVDLLVEEGHIDDCIRKAISCGLEMETALRMATLSPAERFGLHDRGALTPGKVADFCVLSPGKEFAVEKTFRRGQEALLTRVPPAPKLPGNFRALPPRPRDIALSGSGSARVIGLIPHQIVTESLVYPLASGDVPDTCRDILKAVVVSRYRPGKVATGLVHGFGLVSGAIAGSVAHDAHNIVAVGVGDSDLCSAISLVIEAGGGLAGVNGNTKVLIPLPCAGLMSTDPFEQVYRSFRTLEDLVKEMGGIDQAFMYLSFLSLTVIPRLRIAEQGLFDVERSTEVPLFQSTT